MSAKYYQSQIASVIIAQEDSSIPFKFQIVGDNSKTNWMNLNSESAAQMIGFCQAIIDKEAKEETFSCHECGEDFIITPSGVSHHLTKYGYISQDLDADHTAFTLKE